MLLKSIPVHYISSIFSSYSISHYSHPTRGNLTHKSSLEYFSAIDLVPASLCFLSVLIDPLLIRSVSLLTPGSHPTFDRVGSSSSSGIPTSNHFGPLGPYSTLVLPWCPRLVLS